MANKPRDTYKYLVKRGNKVLDGGITKDLKRREQERQQEYPEAHLMKVGIRTTEDGARKWEKKEGYS
jgi:predicted GIY-YIG superfamily endonuclease